MTSSGDSWSATGASSCTRSGRTWRPERPTALNPWGVALFETIGATDPQTFPEETAYAKWLDQTSDREEARRDRTHGAEGVIPSSLWIVMLFAAGVIFVFLLFFADPQ